ncbi:MAG: hypothetical protein IKD73_08390 [Selenomonadaceae bacterium]|nr:hypothetical protein [Selenomonadaceae bacterium]
MAKYTETLQEYLEGGGLLPTSSFALIEGFEDLFKERFCDSEIGFETETLFLMKLDMRAKIVMPVYADKIAIRAAQIAGLKTAPAKVRYETRVYGAQHSETSNDGKSTELPLDPATTLPNSTTETSGEADVDAHTDEFTFDEGLSADERLRLIDAMNAAAAPILEECLNEFKPLFMGVY